MIYTIYKFDLPEGLHLKITKDFEANILISKDDSYPSLDIVSKQYKERYNAEFDLQNYIFESEKDYTMFLLKWL